MFDRRLKILLWILGGLACGLLARLVQLQVLRADIYREEARNALLRPIRILPCVRGRILDRRGRILAQNEPCWDVCVPYGILAGEADYITALAEQLSSSPKRRSRVSEADVERLRSRISEMWPAIAAATGVGLDELAEQRERIVQRVQRIKQVVREKQGLDRRIAEERASHPVVRGLGGTAAVEARNALSAFPWVRVVASTQRRYLENPSIAHLVGRLADTGPDDVFAQEAAGTLHGVSGIERMAEDWLRGTPGTIAEDIDGRPVSAPVDPVDGSDVQLAIDAALNQRIHDHLARAVSQYPLCTGGAAVVVDIASREVLAAVTCPSYSPNADPAERNRLRADRKNLPLRFRAVGELYPPGSTVKPLVAAAALSDAVVTPDSQVECRGRLFPDVEAFRCTVSHGPMAMIDAITHSCNVYFYTLGEMIGVPRLRTWYDAVGFGFTGGTGLPEDVAGKLPVRANKGDARNVAIGQGELAVSPLHIANLMATIATGDYRPATVIHNDTRPRPNRSLGIAPSAWAVVRTGMHNVVNEPGGTAYGKMETPPEPWVLLGKTGSAQGWPRELDRVYTCEWPDGRREEIVSTDGTQLRRFLADRGPFKIVGYRANNRWPPDGREAETHGWFAGYLIDRDDFSRIGEPPRRGVAFAVVLEYAGHGGAVAAPVASEITEALLEVWPEKG